MRIFAVHNYYQQRGGEDQCFEDEVKVLEQNGHDVYSYTVHNDLIESQNKIVVAVNSIWNRSVARDISKVIRDFKPDVLHAMNTFPLLSPALLKAARQLGVPVVHEVSNYRFACAGGFFLRGGKICEMCLHRTIPWPAVRYKCYRSSRAGSATVAASIGVHRWLQTWNRYVNVFLCPSQIAKAKLSAFGIPSKRIIVKQNALNYDPGMNHNARRDFVFVGRISQEKGVAMLLQTWMTYPHLPNLKIIGDGPLANDVQAASLRDSRIQYLGKQPLNQVLNEVGEARFLIMPSIWNEIFGRTTIEAFAKGTPVIGSNLGGTAEIVTHGVNGFLFEAGNCNDLYDAIQLSLTMTDSAFQEMRSAARRTFEDHYTAAANYSGLINAYETAIRIAESG